MRGGMQYDMKSGSFGAECKELKGEYWKGNEIGIQTGRIKSGDEGERMRKYTLLTYN